MNYVYWYLGIGIPLLAVVYAAHHLTKDKALESLHARLAEFHPDRKKLSYRILNNLVAPALTVVSILILWPIAICLKVKLLLSKKGSDKSLKETEFSVDRQHLLDRLAVSEIEELEVVTDRLGAVPELPFGHLNAAWTDFLENHMEGNELWSFSARWEPKWGRQEIRSGYVIVHDGVPGAYFLMVRKEIPEKADDKADHVGFDGIPGWLRMHAD